MDLERSLEAGWSPAPTSNSSFETNDCSHVSPARMPLQGRASLLVGTRRRLTAALSVARVRPGTSKGITDLLLPRRLRLDASPAVPLQCRSKGNISGGAYERRSR